MPTSIFVVQSSKPSPASTYSCCSHSSVSSHCSALSYSCCPHSSVSSYCSALSYSCCPHSSVLSYSAVFTHSSVFSYANVSPYSPQSSAPPYSCGSSSCCSAYSSAYSCICSEVYAPNTVFSLEYATIYSSSFPFSKSVSRTPCSSKSSSS